MTINPKNPQDNQDRTLWLILTIALGIAVGWYGCGSSVWLEYQRKQSERAWIDECKRQAVALGINGSVSDREVCRVSSGERTASHKTEDT